MTDHPPDPDGIVYRVSPPVGDDELNALYDSAWPHHKEQTFATPLAHTLAYVCAYAGERLVGFVKMAWDGEIHAFLLDPTVHPEWQRRGIGTALVRRATAVAAERGMEWLHVDYDPHLDGFYRGCGFRHTPAGLINLRRRE